MTKQVLPRAERTASVLGIDRRALQHVHQPDPGFPDVQSSLLGGLPDVALLKLPVDAASLRAPAPA